MWKHLESWTGILLCAAGSCKDSFRAVHGIDQRLNIYLYWRCSIEVFYPVPWAKGSICHTKFSCWWLVERTHLLLCLLRMLKFIGLDVYDYHWLVSHILPFINKFARVTVSCCWEGNNANGISEDHDCVFCIFKEPIIINIMFRCFLSLSFLSV